MKRKLIVSLALALLFPIQGLAQEATPEPTHLVPMVPVEGPSLSCGSFTFDLKYFENFGLEIEEEDQKSFPLIAEDCTSFSVVGHFGTTSYAIIGTMKMLPPYPVNAMVELTGWPWAHNVVPAFVQNTVNLTCVTDEADITITVSVFEHPYESFGGSHFSTEMNCPGSEPSASPVATM